MTQRHQALLTGSIWALSHFSNNIDVPISAADKYYRVYELLENAVEMPDISDGDRDKILKTITFIKTYCQEGENTSFSEVIRQSESKYDATDDDGKIILQTAGHAYNAGLVRSINPQIGSYVDFYYGAPIGLYYDTLTDVLIPTSQDVDERSAFRAMRTIGFDWELDGVSWSAVSHVRNDQKATKSALEFQKSLIRSEKDEKAIEDAVRQHIDNLTRLLVDTPKSKFTPWLWVLGPSVSVLVGSMVGFPDVGGTVGAGLNVAGFGFEKFRHAGARYIAAETNRDAARKMVPRDSVKVV